MRNGCRYCKMAEKCSYRSFEGCSRSGCPAWDDSPDLQSDTSYKGTHNYGEKRKQKTNKKPLKRKR